MWNIARMDTNKRSEVGTDFCSSSWRCLAQVVSPPTKGCVVCDRETHTQTQPVRPVKRFSRSHTEFPANFQFLPCPQWNFSRHDFLEWNFLECVLARVGGAGLQDWGSPATLVECTLGADGTMKELEREQIPPTRTGGEKKRRKEKRFRQRHLWNVFIIFCCRIFNISILFCSIPFYSIFSLFLLLLPKGAQSRIEEFFYSQCHCVEKYSYGKNMATE